MKSVRQKQARKKRTPTFWRAMTLFVAIGALSLAAWVSYSPLLETPQDVKRCRKLFLRAKTSFLHNPHYWHTKRKQIGSKIVKELQEHCGEGLPYLVRDITPEMVLSYAVDVLDVPLSAFEGTSVFPKISGSSFVVLFSKQENSLWPLPVIVSLEVEVRFEQQGAMLIFRRLRRGMQELAPTHASMYFGSDLERKYHFHDGCFFHFF